MSEYLTSISVCMVTYNKSVYGSTNRTNDNIATQKKQTNVNALEWLHLGKDDISNHTRVSV